MDNQRPEITDEDIISIIRMIDETHKKVTSIYRLICLVLIIGVAALLFYVFGIWIPLMS